MRAETSAVRMAARSAMAALLITTLTFASICYSAIPTYQPVPDPDGSFPWPSLGCTSVDLSPDKARVYARKNWPAGWDEGYVAFDANTGALVQEYRFGSHVDSAPWAGRVSADNAYLYYTTYYGGAVKKRDAVTGGYAVPPGGAGIPVGSWPSGLGFDSERRYLYAGQGNPGTGAIGSIKKIDTTTDSVVGSATLNGEPGACIVVSPDDQYVYVVSHVTSTETLYKIRTSDLSVVGTPLEIAGVGGPGFSLSMDGSKAYVPHPSADKVYVIDTATMTKTPTEFAVNNPNGFWLSPDGSHALVTSIISSTQEDIQVFDMASESVVQTISITGLTGAAYGFYPVSWDWDNGLNAVYIPVSATGGGVAKLVPEPAALSLLALGGLALIRRSDPHVSL